MILRMKKMYLDYASLTPIDRRVMKEIKKYSGADYGNPSALYASAVAAKKAVESAKKRIAAVLHAHSDEIVFTSGGTESNQLALFGKNVLTSDIEHSSIARKNAVSVNSNGVINLEELKKKITADTEMVSIMYVNNETGAIQPISDIAKVVRDTDKKYNKKILFHTDASQAGLLPLHVEKLGVDLMTLDGSKLYGPRGVGILYVKRGTVQIERAGTANVPAIMGFALALEIAEKSRDKESARLAGLKDFFIKNLPKAKINGDVSMTSPHILNISIPGIDNEYMILKLDARGIECSTKSACLFNEDESYVLKAMGADSASSIRFSFGRGTTKSQLKKVLKNIIL